MKKEVKKNNENEKDTLIESVSLKEVGKAYILDDFKEGEPKDEISQYPDTVASPETKKELIHALEKADKIMKPTDEGVVINVKNSKKGIKQNLKRDIDINKTEQNTERKEIKVKDSEKIR